MSAARRRRLAFALAAASVLVCMGTAIQQWYRLDKEPLRWDFAQFWQAAVDLNAGHDPYQAFLGACPGTHWCQGGYIFPPMLAEALRPLGQLSALAAARIWLVLSYLLLALAVGVVGRALRELITPTAAASLLAAALLFLPLYQSLYFLQVGVLLLLLLALTVSATMRDRRAGDLLAGAWLGVAVILRVSPALLLPTQLRLGAGAAGRSRVRVIGALAAMVIAGGLLFALLLLTPYTSTYFSAVLPRISGGTGSEDNMSLPGVVVRASDLLGAPEPSAIVVGLLLAALFIVPAWILWQLTLVRPRVDHRVALAAGLAALLAAMPIVSSITWQHHLVTELLVFALIVPALLWSTNRPMPRGVSIARWLACISYPLLWVDRHVTDQAVLFLHLDGPSGWKVWPFLLITRTPLAGMICLWLACLLCLRSLAISANAEDDDSVAIVNG